MDAIRQRFIQAEQDFMLAARSGDNVTEFADRWETLQSDWESCLHEADRATRRLVNEIAARIEELAGDLVTFESHSVSLEDDLINSIEEVFACLTLEDRVVDHGNPSSGELVEVPGSLQPSHEAIPPPQWLLRNLHNPYPLPHVQFTTDRTGGSKHTKDWFAKARQRIGWTRMLRDRFAGCRSLAIDAAFRAFVRDDPHNPLDIDLKTAFLAIKSHAELVYGGETAMSPPSPKRLRSISPTPSLTFSSGSEDTDDELCPVLPSEGNFTRPSKRTFSDSSDFPPPKRKRIHQSLPCMQPKDSGPITSVETLPSRPGKRRLSETGRDCPRPKRPRGMEDGRLHAVSDPLPSATVPGWFDFDQTFQLPNPASTDPLESSSFDLDFFNAPSLPSPIVPSVTGELIQRQPTFITLTPHDEEPPFGIPTTIDDFPLFEMPQLDLFPPTPPIFDCDWTEFLNFEPEFSFFPFSPSLSSSSANTPPLVDDATLSPSSHIYSNPCSPNSFLEVLPHSSEKGVQLPAVGEPIIQGQEFLLPPGENAGIPSASALLSVH